MNARALVVRSDGEVRALWAIAAFVLVAMLAYGLVQGTAYPLAAMTPLVGWAREYRISLSDIAAIFSLLAATRICRQWIDRERSDFWAPVGLGRDALGGRALLIGLAAGLLTILVPSALLLAASRFGIVADVGPAQPLSAFRVDSFLLLPSAAFEEVLTRGYILFVLMRALGPRWAIVITSIAFGLAHLENPDPTVISLAAVMMGGVLLAAVRIATGSLYAAIVAHFAWNFAQAGLLAAPVSGMALRTPGYHLVDHGPTWLTGGSWGPEGGLAAVAAMIVTTFLLLRRPLRGPQPTLEISA